MGPFTFAGLSETFTLLMNTPLVPTDSSKSPRDVPLTEMPSSTRYSKESRRQSNSSDMSTSSHGSSENQDDESWAYVGLSRSSRSPSPPSSSAKQLPPLPTGSRQSRVRFADDVDVEL